MKKTDRVRLLGAPYRPPALRVGDRAACLYRDCDVVITGWTDAPISWPLCIPVGGVGKPILLVDDELLRAIRTESAAALMHWWGVCAKVPWQWRRAFAIGRAGTLGSARLVKAAAQLGADATKARAWTNGEREQRRRRAVRMNAIGVLRGGYTGDWWSAAEIDLLGTVPDAQVAAQIGRTVDAVRQKREEMGIASRWGRKKGSDV